MATTTSKTVAAVVEEEPITTIVHFTNGAQTKEAFYLELKKSDLDDETLSDLRTNIAGITSSIEISNFPFCGRSGAVVPDSFSVQKYLNKCLGIDTATAVQLSVYMLDPMISDRQESRGTITGAPVSSVLEANKTAMLKNAVDDVAFKWITGTQAKYTPELEQRDWATVSESNALCYGIRVIRARAGDETTNSNSASTSKKDPKGIPMGVERARSPAFRLKKRAIWSDNLPTSTIDGVKLDLRIPDFIIDDKSYMSVYETETEMQSSMATSSFSESDVAAAASASYMGFSASVSASFAMESSQAAKSDKTKKTKKITIAYNFPRVTVFLDSRSVELTPDCEDALRTIESIEDVEEFQSIYGEFFSSRVQLGGRLFSTEEVEGTSASSSKEKADSMKLAASASFGGYGASASLSASHKQGSESQKAQSSSDSSSNLNWQANGGDTLLCNQPTEWAPTVAYHWNWRITKQDGIVGIFDIASQISGMGWLAEKTKELGIKVDPKATLIPSMSALGSRVPGKRFTLNLETVPNGRYLLTFRDTAMSLAPAAEARNATRKNNFSIDADLRSRGCACLGPTKAESKESLRIFEAEDINGTPVSELKWNTKYRLRNVESKAYVDFHETQNFRFLYPNFKRSTTHYIVFNDAKKGNVTEDIIPGGSSVILRFYDHMTGHRLGYVWNGASGPKYAYLFVDKPTSTDDDEAKLMITYQD